jgi:hypothetical protein
MCTISLRITFGETTDMVMALQSLTASAISSVDMMVREKIVVMPLVSATTCGKRGECGFSDRMIGSRN